MYNLITMCTACFQVLIYYYISGQWIQYDGIVTFKKSGWDYFMSFLTDSKKEWKKHASEFADMFSPLKRDDILQVHCFEEAVEELHYLMNGLRRVYYVDFRCWYDEKDFRNKVKIYGNSQNSM